MNELTIPKRVAASFQMQGNDKVGYLVCEEENGMAKASKVWINWSDPDLNNQSIENVPTQGFVLANTDTEMKGNSSICNIVDPRGFLVRISLDNLLMLLKYVPYDPLIGFKGRLMYGWNRSQMLLIPEKGKLDSKVSSESSDDGVSGDPAEDLQVGAEYRLSNGRVGIYMGLVNRFQSGYEFTTGGVAIRSTTEPRKDQVDEGTLIRSVQNLLYGEVHCFATRKTSSKTKPTFNFVTFDEIKGDEIVECVCEQSIVYKNALRIMKRMCKFNAIDESYSSLVKLDTTDLAIAENGKELYFVTTIKKNRVFIKCTPTVKLEDDYYKYQVTFYEKIYGSGIYEITNGRCMDHIFYNLPGQGSAITLYELQNVLDLYKLCYCFNNGRKFKEQSVYVNQADHPTDDPDICVGSM